MSDKKVPKTKKVIAKTKKIPRIRVVTLDKKIPAGEVDKQDKGCCKETCPCACDSKYCFCQPVECRCVIEPPCLCEFKHVPQPCSCVDHVPPCSYEIPCSQTTIPSNPKSGSKQKEQQTPKEGKGTPRTLFKVSKKRASDH
jgi:hypothetical protein